MLKNLICAFHMVAFGCHAKNEKNDTGWTLSKDFSVMPGSFETSFDSKICKEVFQIYRIV